MLSPVTYTPRLLKRIVDDILEIIKKGQADNLTQNLNQAYAYGSIKFTYEEETLPILITLSSGTIELLVYRKSTPTDKYRQFDSHHALQHKHGLIRSLYGRCVFRCLRKKRTEIKRWCI